jgi:hypothetical protein
MSRILKDKSGHYLIGAIASMHPMEIKGDQRDQNKVTAIHTAIATVGGQTHHTTIPWDEATAAYAEYHEGPPPAAPKKDAPPAP